MKENPRVFLPEDKIRKYSNFRALFIKDVRETDFNTDRNDAVVANLKRLRGSMKNKGQEYLILLHPNKNEIKKAILEKYKEYPILKLISKEKNPIYEMEKRLRDGKYKAYHPELKRNAGILKSFFDGYSYNELTEDDKEEMEERSDDTFIDNKNKIEEIVNGIESREKDELYKLIMEKVQTNLKRSSQGNTKKLR